MVFHPKKTLTYPLQFFPNISLVYMQKWKCSLLIFVYSRRSTDWVVTPQPIKKFNYETRSFMGTDFGEPAHTCAHNNCVTPMYLSVIDTIFPKFLDYP